MTADRDECIEGIAETRSEFLDMWEMGYRHTASLEDHILSELAQAGQDMDAVSRVVYDYTPATVSMYDSILDRFAKAGRFNDMVFYICAGGTLPGPEFLDDIIEETQDVECKGLLILLRSYRHIMRETPIPDDSPLASPPSEFR